MGIEVYCPKAPDEVHVTGQSCKRCQSPSDDFYQAQAMADYLDRMNVEPSLMLRRVADRYPEFEWLCWLPEDERHWYMTVGDQEYVKQSWFVYLAPWAYETLAS
jgi:hypothetical protein